MTRMVDVKCKKLWMSYSFHHIHTYLDLTENLGIFSETLSRNFLNTLWEIGILELNFSGKYWHFPSFIEEFYVISFAINRMLKWMDSCVIVVKFPRYC